MVGFLNTLVRLTLHFAVFLFLCVGRYSGFCRQCPTLFGEFPGFGEVIQNS